MKKIKFFALLAIVVTAFSISSCKKDDEPTNEELITAHSWKGAEYELYEDGDLVNEQDISDYKFVFNDDKTYKVYNNGDLIQSGTWSLISGSKDKIVFDEDDEFIITRLNSTKFEYYQEAEVYGSIYKVVYKLVK